MKRSLILPLAGLALLSVPALASAHTATVSGKCDVVTIDLTKFATSFDSSVNYGVTVNGLPVESGVINFRTNTIKTVAIPATLVSDATLITVNANWTLRDHSGNVTRTIGPLDCVPDVPPVAPEPPAPAPEPPPVVTPPPPPVNPPAPPVKSCADLIKAKVGKKWLEKKGCIKKPLKCPRGKVDIINKDGKRVCVWLIPPPVRNPVIPVTG